MASQQRLLVDAADVRRDRHVVQLRLDQRFADCECTVAGPQLAREVVVEALAVLHEVGVAVLVAGASDQRRLLPREGLRPVERHRDAGDRVAVDDVVAGMASRAEHDRVGEVGGRGDEVGGEQAGSEVRGERAVGAEVSGEEDHVVAAAEEHCSELRRGPRRRILRRLAVGRDQRVRRGAGALLQLRLDCGRFVGEEVVSCHQRGGRRDDSVGNDIGVDHPGDVRRRFDQSADGEPRHGEIARRQRDLGVRPIAILAQYVVQPQAGFRRRIALHRRHVTRFIGEPAHVWRAEERDHAVVAGDDHEAQRIRPIGVNDALDLLRDQVLRERARRVVRRLLLERSHPRIARNVDHHARDFGARCERGELVAQRFAT